MKNNRNNKRVLLWIVLAILLIFAAGTIWYLSDDYHADSAAMETIHNPSNGITVVFQNDAYIFRPEEPKAGLIFYPGGKVDFEAYAPLMERLAEHGFLCVLLHVHQNLAVLEPNAADGVIALFPEITGWYIGGHSLGGVIASTYAAKHREDFAGLVLLGAYSTADFSGSDYRAVSIYGSEDRVLSIDAYRKNRNHLPVDTIELVLQGGCHSYFGNYGEQKGDGTPSISREEQQRLTAETIALLCAQ